eukprot:1237431-Pleurochrysis_carterae.AAC.1
MLWHEPDPDNLFDHAIMNEGAVKCVGVAGVVVAAAVCLPDDCRAKLAELAAAMKGCNKSCKPKVGSCLQTWRHKAKAHQSAGKQVALHRPT